MSEFITRAEMEIFIRKQIEEAHKLRDSEGRQLTDDFVKKVTKATVGQLGFVRDLAAEIVVFLDPSLRTRCKECINYKLALQRFDVLDKQIEKITEELGVGEELMEQISEKTAKALLDKEVPNMVKEISLEVMNVQMEKKIKRDAHKWGIFAWPRKYPIRTVVLLSFIFISGIASPLLLFEKFFGIKNSTTAQQKAPAKP